MNELDFRKAYECEFKQDENAQRDYEMVERYFAECEAYDRTVCSGPIGPEGGILPGGGREAGLICRNAIATKLRICQEFGVTKDYFHDARIKYLKKKR